MFTKRARRASSDGVRVSLGRRVESLLKRTSGGIWRRDCVAVKTFSGEKTGRVRARRRSATPKRTVRARETEGGRGWMDMPCARGAFRTWR